jgi:hypothetical protein
MYGDKKLALICSFLMATFWEILFTSMRFQVDVPAIFFGFLSIYVFFKGYEKKETILGIFNPKWAMTLTLLLVVITYSIRRGYFLFGFFFLFYIIATKPFKEIIKDKYNWIGLGISIVLFLLIEKTLFTQFILDSSATYFHPEFKITGLDLKIFPVYFSNIFSPVTSSLMYLFYLGTIIILLNLIFHWGYFKKTKDSLLKGDIFIFLSFLITFSYFIFYQRNTLLGEPRWYYPFLLGSFVCVGRGGVFIYDSLKKYSKYFALMIIILLVGFGGYYEYQHGDFIIKEKLDSFSGIKEVGLLLAEISEPEDIIISIPRPQPAYYAERRFLQPQEIYNKNLTQFQTTLEDFLNALNKPENKNVKFLIITLSEPNHPDWMKIQTSTSVKFPFLDTIIDFQTGEQKIEQSKSYGNITFNLITIKKDAFVYKIIHNE